MNAPNGGTVLLDNIRFTPVPTSQQDALGLPLSTQTFGVVPLPAPASGAIPFPDDQELTNVSTTYEAALTEEALLHQGTPAALAGAELIDNTFVYALAHDNQGDPLPLAPDGSAGLHNAYMDGDIALYNSQQPPEEGQAGQVRLAGFSVSTAFVPSGFALVLDGATGGNNAFAILALTAGYDQLHNPSYLAAAEEIGHWIVGNLADTSGTGYGGYYVGYPDQGQQPKTLQTSKSVENNADIFAAFTSLAAIESALGNSTQADYWTTQANVAGDFVMAMFDPTNGCFYAGTVPAGTAAAPGIDPSGPLKGNDVVNTYTFIDSDTFTTLAMAGAPRYENQIDWRRPIQYALANFAQTVTADGTTYQGFDIVEQPVSGPNGIAWEFTGQVVAAMQYVDNLYGTSLFSNSASFYLGQIDQAQATAPFGDGEGLVASTLQDGDALPPIDQCLNTPFQTIPERVGLAATTWAIFADQGINVFAPPPQVIATSSSASSSTYGQSLTFSVTVTPSVSGSPTPTGTVQFQVDGSNFGPAVTLFNGAATSISTATLSAGVHAITAFYSGDWNDAANSGRFSQTVDPAALTITAKDASKTYGQTLTFAGTEFTDSGLVNGNTVSSVTLTSNGAPASAQVTSSPYPIIPSAAGGSGLSNYTISYVNGNLTINKAHLTVTADNKSKTQGNPNPPLTSTITGFVNGDKPTVVSGAAVLTTSATTSSLPGSYPITVVAGTLSAANYDFPNLVNGTLTVTAPLVASVIIVPSVPFPTYGQALTFRATVSPASSGGPTPGGTVQFQVDGVNLGQAVTLVKGAATSIATFTLGAGNHTVTAVYSGNNTYAGNSKNRGVTVAKAHLTVSAVAKSKVYGAAVPTLTATFSGFVNGDTAKVVSGAAKLTTTATTKSGVGTYPITIAKGTLSAANYDFPNLVNGTLTVTKAQLTVTAVNKSKKQGAANPALTYTITGFVNGDKSTVVHGKPTLSTTATKTSKAGSYPIIVALGTLSASNYHFTLVNGTLTVTGAKAAALGVAGAQAPDSEASPSPFDRLIPRWWRKGHGLSRNS